MAKKNGKNGNGKVNYDAALNYPLFEAIFNRRSRRFGAGMELPSDSSLGHKSEIPPIALTEFQEAMLVWAGTGLTGLCLADLPPENGIDLLCQWTGRTWPSACNNHGTELFFTNDSGLYWVDVKNMLPKDKELDMFFKLDRDDKVDRLLELYRDGLVKLEDGRANLPDKMPGLFDFNQWNTNKPGTTTFIPVTDITEEYLNLLTLYCSSTYAFNIWDEKHDRSCGQDKWIKSGRIKEEVKMSLYDLEVRILTGLNVEQAFICQNMSLALQALGLGGWTFTGLIPRFTLGSNPELFKGLGFRFEQPKSGPTRPVGRDGVFQGYCPPYYKSMSEAYDAMDSHKWAAWDSSKKPFPYEEPDKHLVKAPRPTDTTSEIVKSVADYIHDTYGSFPAFVDPMYMRLVFQAQNLDLDFYDKYYPPGSYTDQHVNTFKYFQPEIKNPYSQKPAKKYPWDK